MSAVEVYRVSISCPRCGQDDRVQKVSDAYVHGGVESGEEADLSSNGLLPVARDQRAPLSIKLKWPPRPKPGQGAARYANRIFPRTPLRLLIVGGACAVVGYAIAWKLGESALTSLGAAVLAPLFILALAIDIIQVYIRLNPKVRRAAEQIDEQMLAEWRVHMGIWNRAWYCHRDDWVFVPEAPSHPGGPATNLWGLLDDPSLQATAPNSANRS